MAHHIYELAFQKTTTAAAGPIASFLPGTLGTGVQPPEVREMGIFNQSGAAAEFGLAQAVNAITGTSGVLVQQLTGWENNGDTTVYTSWSTAPTAPTNFFRRAQLQATAGSGVIWTWEAGEFVIWNASFPQLVLWQLSSAIVTYDCYIKVHE